MKESIIDNVIDEIRSSEQAADELIEEARQAGKDAVLAAQSEAEKRREQNRQAVKELRRQSQADTARRANEKREAILRKGEAAAKELIENKNSSVEEAASAVAEGFVASYRHEA